MPRRVPTTDEARARRAVELIKELVALRFECVTCDGGSERFLRDGLQLLHLASKHNQTQTQLFFRPPRVTKKKCEATHLAFLP